MAVYLRGTASPDKPEGVYLSFSTNLIEWSDPRLLLALKVFKPDLCKQGDAPSYWYPSLIDPSDTSRNFEYVGSSAYLFLTKFNQCTYSNRDLVKVEVEVPTEVPNAGKH